MNQIYNDNIKGPNKKENQLGILGISSQGIYAFCWKISKEPWVQERVLQKVVTSFP